LLQHQILVHAISAFETCNGIFYLPSGGSNLVNILKNQQFAVNMSAMMMTIPMTLSIPEGHHLLQLFQTGFLYICALFDKILNDMAYCSVPLQ